MLLIPNVTWLIYFQDRYDQILPVIRIWRHLKMLKRSARGHDPLGIESTVEGECAVECPACPHPGKNLPPNWKDAAATVRYALYLLDLIGTDALTVLDGYMLLF